MKKIGILYHPKVEATRLKARELEDYLCSQGYDAWCGSSWDKDGAEAMLADTELLLTVGGDGTVLRAAQMALSRKIPITGINLGKLGFMTELEADEVPEKLTALLENGGWIDQRAMLQVEVSSGTNKGVYHALNDVVVARGEVPRLLRVLAGVDGQYLTTYKTDGLILATATGSTGYALAAGGPVMYPQSADYVMIPVSPHLCLDKALVLPSGAEVELSVDTFQPAVMSVDGHINVTLTGGDTLVVKHSPESTYFRRIRPRESFYHILEEKLRGKRVEGRKSQNP